VAIQIPYGAEDQYKGSIDLVRWILIQFDSEDGTVFEELPIPDEMLEEATAARESMIESVVEFDDVLLERYLAGESVSEADLRRVIRHATLHNHITPVLCGSSLKNKGVQQLLDSVLAYLPSPLDVGHVHGHDVKNPDREDTRPPSDEAPFSALAFKVLTDPFVGRLTFIRVYSGTLKAGEQVLNVGQDKKERAGKILRMSANKREELSEVFAGDIVAIPALRFTRTGETLVDAKHPILLEPIDFAEPVINQAIEARTLADQDRLLDALQRLMDEDPTFRFFTDPETGQIIISGVGELHLEILADRLNREFGVPVKVGKPQVAFRETVSSPARGQGEFIRSVAGKNQFGQVTLEVRPNDPGKGLEFSNELSKEALPEPYAKSVAKGALEALKVGPVAGYPMIDVMAVLVDAAYNEEDATETAYAVSASIAARDAVRKASPLLMEPVFEVEVVTPEEHVGDVIADLSSRMGRIEGIQTRDVLRVVTAMVPLSQMFGYVTQLRSLTQGRGAYTMKFRRYEPAVNKR
jgi:elongation factor G